METRRNRWQPAWAVCVLLLSWPVLGARCPDDPSGGSGGASGSLGPGEGENNNASGGDPAEDGSIDVDFDVCVEADCGPALGMPNWICSDGTVAGPTGACIPTADGSCGWEVLYCGDANDGSTGAGDGGDDGGTGVACDSCPGPAPGMPNRECADGTLGGPSCELNTDGSCTWHFRDCPDEGGGGEGNACDSCPGPAPGMANWECPDGTIGGPSCEPDANGTCGWTIRQCPAPDDGGGGDGGACDPDECPSPAPGMPNWICDDGTVGGPVCEADSAGSCGWSIRECPGSGGGGCECPDPAPGMPNWICDDGSIGGPVCQADPATNTCAWAIVECPSDPNTCESADEACDDCPGPAPGMPNWLCDSGCVGGPACLRDVDGACTWHILDCE